MPGLVAVGAADVRGGHPEEEDRSARRAGKRYEQRAASINKCVDIINGLSSSLDTDSGGAVVANLANLYEFCATRLHGAGIKQDPAMIDEVVKIMTTIRQGWAGVQARNG